MSIFLTALHFAYLLSLADAVPAPQPVPKKPAAPKKPAVPAPKPIAPVPKPAAPKPITPKKPAAPAPKPTVPVPQPSLVGPKKMLMIPLKFADHLEHYVPGTEILTILMKNDVVHKQICPSGSVKDYFLENSYGLLELDITVAPWVTVPETEAYYGNGSSGHNNYRSHILIRDALKALEDIDFDFTPFDADNDGYIDAVGFFHSGYDGVYENPDVFGTSYLNRIESHTGSLYSLPGGKWTSSSGISVTGYHISTSLSGTSGTEIVQIGTIVYQIARYFGIPSLDDRKGLGEGLGRFCLMGTGYLGWDGTRSRPTLMSAWPKIQAGWVIPIEITSTGSYTAGRACSVPEVFKISQNFPEGEYLLIENRYPCGYDSDLPGSGLAICHIDEWKPDNNDAGYPDQDEWPGNGKHYRVALLPGHGNYLLETTTMVTVDDSSRLNYGGYLFGEYGESIGRNDYPNTDSYKNGDISKTCITITVSNREKSDDI